VTRRGAAADAGLALLALALSVAVLAAGGLGTRSPDAAVLDVRGLLLAAAASLPLAWRRRTPMTVYLLVAAATVALVAGRYPLDFPFGLVVAVHALAAAHGGDPSRRWRWAARAAAALFVPAVAIVFAAYGYSSQGALTGVLFWALAVLGAWLGGELTRLRAERIAELEERAARAERDADRERALAAAEERTRIARELHDSAGHAINVILVQAGAARLLTTKDPQRAVRAIATVEQVARDTIGEIDRLVHALRTEDPHLPDVPADPGAFEELLARHRADGLRLDATVTGTRSRLPRAVAWAAHRILQESLTNAARHGTGSASVDLRFTPTAVQIQVTNPLCANSPAGQHGHGIVGMRERATLLGGNLAAAAANGVFRLQAELPYAEAPR
jgi:signal transduction histidine kinase